jgi:hypothetical protein
MVMTPPPPSAAPPTPAASGSPPDRAGQAAAQPLPRQGLERLDLLLLCVEALDLNGGETLVWMGQNLGYAALFPDRVALWRLRSHNPLRRACRRGSPDANQTDALIRLLCAMADRIYPMLRGLLSSREPEQVNQQHWRLFQERLTELLRERMNVRRSGVQALMDPERGAEQRRALVQTLALAAGTGGFDRLRASLFDAAP